MSSALTIMITTNNEAKIYSDILVLPRIKVL